MDVSVVEAKNQLSKLLKAVHAGESVVITRNGKPIAQLTLPPRPKKKVVLGAMRDKIKLYPGWENDLPWEEWMTT